MMLWVAAGKGLGQQQGAKSVTGQQFFLFLKRRNRVEEDLDLEAFSPVTGLRGEVAVEAELEEGLFILIRRVVSQIYI